MGWDRRWERDDGDILYVRISVYGFESSVFLQLFLLENQGQELTAITRQIIGTISLVFCNFEGFCHAVRRDI